MNKIFANRSIYRLRTITRLSPVGNFIRKIRDLRTPYDQYLIRSGKTPEKAVKKYHHLLVTDGYGGGRGQEVNIEDMKRMARERYFDYDEYFMFRLYKKDEEARKEFIPDYEHNFYHIKLNSAFDGPIFHDKWNSYLKYQKYYKRDVLLVDRDIQKLTAAISGFLKKHSSFIFKPIYGGSGEGVKIFKTEECGGVDGIIKSLTKIRETNPFPFIIEEIVTQDDRIKILHPDSLNTCRITTINCGNEIKVIHPVLRVGQGKSIVDNAGAGGIVCGIDMDTYKICATMDELGNIYDKHPDTGVDFIGFEVPEFAKALEMARELARIVPTTRYVGWDLALSDKGWVLIEANADGMFVTWQLVYQKGFRTEMDAIMRKLNLG